MARTEQVTINSVTYTCEKRSCVDDLVVPITGGAAQNLSSAHMVAMGVAQKKGWSAWKTGGYVRYYCPAHEPSNRSGFLNGGPRWLW